MNVETIKIIMSEKKKLLSLRNQEGKTVKVETERVNKLTHISTNITELNDLFYVGAKLVCEEHEQKFKTCMAKHTENTDKKSTTISKNT